MTINKIIDEKITIADIEQYFVDNNSGPFFSMFETGLDSLKFDLIRINPYQQYVRIFEFKSCRADFTSDHKWQKYLPYCHTFTFVCPKEVILPNDLPPGIGLLWVFKWRWDTEISLWRTGSKWMKRPRKRDVNKDILLQLAFTMLSRVRWGGEKVF